jgi:hypothetical protein
MLDSLKYVQVITWPHGTMVFADATKLRVSRGDHPRFRVGPKTGDEWPYKRRRGRFKKEEKAT